MTEKPEVVFEVMGEGGGLGISRIIHNGLTRFTLNHHEMDFSDEGLSVSKEVGYSTFEEAFLYIEKYPWHELHVEIVHEDYRGFVLSKLIEKLNEAHVSHKYIRQIISRLERILYVKIYQDHEGEWCYDGYEAQAKIIKM
jgi:hypothetical protein